MNLVHDSMFIANPAGPISSQCVFQRLRFANAFERLSRNVTDKKVYPFERFLVCFLPIQIVFPSIFGEDQLHSASALATPRPASSSAIDSMSLRAFFGLLNKYAVSSSAW